MRRTLNHKLRRRQAKRQVVFIVLGCLIITFLVISVFMFTPDHAADTGETLKEDISREQGQVDEEVAGVLIESFPAVSLGLGGDVCFGLDVTGIIAAEGYAYPWVDIAPVLGDYDITVVNLEGPVCRGGEPNPDQPSFSVKGDSSCISPMAEAGVDVVCLANDHIMDYGSQGLEETLNIIHGQDLRECGAGSSLKMAQQPLVMDTENGAEIALFSFCDVAPPSYTAGEESPGLCAADPELVAELVGMAAQENPYVVVYFHWGTMGSSQITDRQRELSHAAIAAGADLVVGCHPHVMQGLEVWQDVPIIYSLGNLVFCSQSEEGKNGIFAGCHFDDGCLTSLEIIPLQVERARPVPLSGEQAERALQDLSASSPGVDLMIYPQNGKGYIDL